MKNFKRILALVLTLMFIVGSCASLSAFSGTSKWYGTAVNWIESRGIDTIGSSATAEIDRNTFAMWVAKIESTFVDSALWDDKADSTSFADVKAGEHYYAAIAYAEESGFIQGDGDGNFRPGDSIKFSEACAIITRVMGYGEFFESYYAEDRSKYATYDEWYKANWEYNYIRVAQLRCKAIDATWVANVGKYVPQHKLTKGEAAYLLYTLATKGANVRHNGYDMGYKLGASLPSIKVTAVVKTLARKPLDGRQLQGWISGGGGAPLNTQVTKSLELIVMRDYWAERNYDQASQVVTPYSKILDTTKNVELQLFNGENFTGETITLSGTTFQQLVRKSLGKPANVDVANEEVFYLFDYVREGSVVDLTVSGTTVKAVSVATSHVVDTYRVLKSTTNLDYYLNGLANSYGSADYAATLPSSYNAEKDVTAWDGNKLVFQGTTYTLRAKGSNYTGISDEIKVYGYEKVGVSKVESGVTYDKYYTIGTGAVEWVARGTTPGADLGKWLEKGNLVQLTAAEAKAQLINAAQGEVEAVFSDMDGDGKYDVAVVTSYDAFYVPEGAENIAGASAEGYTNGDVRQYAKGVPGAGTVLLNATATASASMSTDAWTLDTEKATNKVQLIFNVSDRHGANGLQLNQWYAGYRSTPCGGTGVIDVLAFASGYIQDVVAAPVEGKYQVTIPVAKTDAETGATTIEYTTAMLPAFGYVPTTQKLSYTLAGAKADITVVTKTWMSFITDFYADNFAYAYKTADGKQFVYFNAADATDTADYTSAEFLKDGEAFIYGGKIVSATEKAAELAKFSYVKTKDVNDLYYSKTTDTELDAAKTYYTWDAGTSAYTAVVTPDVADIGTYYEYNEKTYYVFADAETNTYYEVTAPVATDLSKYYEKVQAVEADFVAASLKVLAGVEGFVTDTKVITDAGYAWELIVLDPADDGIYSRADEASVRAMVGAWVNNKYINYVVDAKSNVILAQSAAAGNGRGFVVNVAKAEDNNTYKVAVASTGTYKSVNKVYYGTGYSSWADIAATRIAGTPTVGSLKAKFLADPTTAAILYCHDDQWNGGFNGLNPNHNVETYIATALKTKTWEESAAKLITGKDIQNYEGATTLKTYNVRASASTIWDIANAATYRAIYGGSLAHDLTVGENVTAKNFYYVTMTKETGSYNVMRLSTGDTSATASESGDYMGGASTKPIWFHWQNNSGHWFNTSWRIRLWYYVNTVNAKEASDIAWPNAGIKVTLASAKSDAFYLAKVDTAASAFVGDGSKQYYKLDGGVYYAVDPVQADFDAGLYYEKVLGKEVRVGSADLAKAASLPAGDVAAFVAKYSYFVDTTTTTGYNPEYVTKAYDATKGKYTFDVTFDRVVTSKVTVNYVPAPVNPVDGVYVVARDAQGNAIKGDAYLAASMSGINTYYSFNGVIYLEIEAATKFNFVKADGTVNFIVAENANVVETREDLVYVSDYTTVDTKSMNMFKSIRAMDKNEAGFVPGYYMVTLASDPTTELKIAGSTNMIVMTPDNAAGKVTSTTTTFKSFVASGSALFASRVQIAVSPDLKTITNITAIGEFMGSKPSDTSATQTGTVVYVGTDATTVLNADETGTSYIVKTDKSAYALDGTEFGPVYYEYDTTSKDFKAEDLKFIVTPGSFYKVDANGKIIANLGSMFGTTTVSKKNVLVGTTTYNYTYDLAKFDNKLDGTFFGTAVITGVSGGKILATVNGEKNVDITGWNVKFIYSDLDATKLFVAEDNSNVSIAGFSEIVAGVESKYNQAALAKAVYEAARDGGVLSAATVAKYKEAYEAAVVELDEAKVAALAKMNGQFWSTSNVEGSAIKRYLDSAKYTYGAANPTLTFTYLSLNDTIYVIVPSFAK